jgi:glucose/arabinose dehydrogenase
MILLLVTSSKKEGIQDPEYYWAPSIAPSGMAFISSDIYPN